MLWAYTKFFFYLNSIEHIILSNIASGTKDFYLVRNELEVILVGCNTEDLMTVITLSLADGAYNVISFEPWHLYHLKPHKPNHLLYSM